jgi:predicted acetyltransferase
MATTGKRMVPFVLRFDCTDFDAFLQEMYRLKTSPNLGEDKVNSSTFWLVNVDRKV